MQAIEIDYAATKHNITEGFYGTFEERFPKTKFFDRVLRKLCYQLDSIGVKGGSNIAQPVFIVGSPRSGTSILEKVIESHNDIISYPGEALDLWFPNSFPWRNSNLKSPPYWVSPKKYTEQAMTFWKSEDGERLKNIFELFFKLKRGRAVFLNKTAMASYSIDRIIALFPNAKFIHIHRDGRAVALSLAQQEFARMQEFSEPYKKGGYFISFGETLTHCCGAWEEQMLGFQNTFKQLGLREKRQLIEISYETFCENPLDTVSEIFAFLNLPSGNSFDKGPLANVHSMNDRLNDLLTKKVQSSMTELMQHALELKGYDLTKIS